MTRNLCLVLAALLLTAGLGLAWIFWANTDLPPLREGSVPFQAEFAAAAQRGQAPYDARVQATESLGLQLLSLGLILGLVARELPPRKFALFVAAAVTCLVFSPLAPRPVPITSGLAGLTRNLPPSSDGAALSFWPAVGALIPWSYAGVAWLMLVSIPAGLQCLAPSEEENVVEFDRYRILAFLGIAAVALLLVLAAYSASPAAGRELVFCALFFNAAILIGKPRRLIPSAFWFLAVVIPILDPVDVTSASPTGPQQDSPMAAELRQKAASGQLFADPALRRVLPESIRPPLKIEEDAVGRAKTGSAFIPSGAPDLTGRDELPSWGTWRPSGPPYPTGTFVSTLFHSNSGTVQIRVAGTLHRSNGPPTDLMLKRSDGRISHPLISNVAALTRWRRINFEVPPGDYQLIATANAPNTWLAFTAPQEIYFAARFANKLVQTWVWWLVAGTALAALLTAVAFSEYSSTFGASGLPLPRLGARLGGFFAVNLPPALIKAAPWLSLTAYALFLFHHLDTTAGPNDSGGYLNSAKLLASHHTTAQPRLLLPGPRPSDLGPYLPSTFVATPDGRLAPTYPVGFPLIIAAVAQLVSLQVAVPLVILGQVCLGVILTFFLARELDLTGGWAWLAAAIIALSPVYLFQALQPQSDGPALVWVTAAIYLAWTSAKHPWRALLAGFATAMAVLIRPSNTLCLLPLTICLFGHWRQLRYWILGGIPGAIFQLWYNQRLYGNPLHTGYGDANDVSAGFGLRFAPLTAHAYLHWLPAFFSPLIFLSVIGPFLRRHSCRARAMLAVWAAVFPLFYAFYWCTYDNWYNMRFVLPAAPALVILGLWTTRWLCSLPRAIPVGFRYAAALLLLGLLVQRSAAERVFFWMRANRVNADAVEWARDHLPANAIVVGRHITGSLFYYSDLAMLRTDSPLAQSPAFYTQMAQAGRPVYAITFHWERHGYKWGHGKGDGYPDAPGQWEHLAEIGEGEVHIWARK